MLKLRGGIAAIAFICLSSSAHAADPLAAGREALAEDNPGDLWVQVGERLFHEKRGPKKASLEQCDFGLGPGKLEGAYAHLPRYFPDTDKVQDLESRLLTCMMTLQGFSREEAIKYHFGDDDHMSNMESLAAFVASKSNGKKMDVAALEPERVRHVQGRGVHLLPPQRPARLRMFHLSYGKGKARPAAGFARHERSPGDSCRRRRLARLPRHEEQGAHDAGASL